MNCLQECKQTFVRSLFEGDQSKKGSESKKGKLTFVSVGSKFKTQLEELMEKLHSTGTSFVRCIKPNAQMVAREFEGGSVLSQLQCAGMTSVLELMQQGFPSRQVSQVTSHSRRGSNKHQSGLNTCSWLWQCQWRHMYCRIA